MTTEEKWKKAWEENQDKVDELCGRLEEYSGQLVTYCGEVYVFECFEQDGILLAPTMFSTLSYVFVAKWFLHEIEIL
jgi:hypothetical protein